MRQRCRRCCKVCKISKPTSSPTSIRRLISTSSPAKIGRVTCGGKRSNRKSRRCNSRWRRCGRARSHRWTECAKRQDEFFVGKVPNYADTRLQNAAVAVLSDIGFTGQELEQLWRGEATIPLRDHRMQLLILNGIKYRDAQQKAKAPVAKPAPPVQRPGVSPPRGTPQDAAIQALNKRLETSGNLKDAAALIVARRKAR